jgi:gamma-glutamyltranspeptidase/glutathione hydrolase
MAFAKKTFSGFIALVALGCNDADPEMTLRAAPQALPDTTLPDDDDSWKQQPNAKKPGSGKAFHDGVAAASEPIVAEAAAAVLANGGNAIDAAVTAMFMLNVAEPQSSGLGGGGFVMLHLAESNETLTLNCRETAPAATTPDIFVSQPDAALRTSSGYSVGVPATLRCAATLLENWGTISLAEALEPAIEAASNGIVVSSRLATDTALPKLSNEMTPADNPVKPAYDVARAVFRPNGAPLSPGVLLVQPALAHTFELIAEFGPDAFYRCDHEAGIAQAIIDTQRVTRLANPDGVGRMTCADLESYQVQVLDPVSRPYEGYEVLSMGPPSSGGIAVLQMLAMLEGYPIGDDDEGFGFGAFSTLNVTLEAMRLAFADRAVWVGDDDCPGCSDVPVTGLLSDEYLATRAALITLGQRRLGIQAGDPRPYDSDVDDASSLADALTTSEPDGDTTHVAIIDASGNIANFTVSIEATWGTGLMVPNLGFLLNNQLTDFNRVPTFNPNPMAYDPGANDPGPRKQPRSSMAPTLVRLDGEPVAAYGSPGGSAIINAVLGVTLNLIDHRLTLSQSVQAPRISLTSAADVAIGEREAGFDLAVILALQALGYQFNQVPAIAAVQAIITIPESGKQYGAADARRIGGVVAADKL